MITIHTVLLPPRGGFTLILLLPSASTCILYTFACPASRLATSTRCLWCWQITMSQPPPQTWTPPLSRHFVGRRLRRAHEYTRSVTGTSVRRLLPRSTTRGPQAVGR